MLNYITLVLASLCPQASLAYLDTTPKDFAKPRPLIVQPHSYVRPKYEIYMDQAAEKIAPKVFSSVMGPAGMGINIADKVIKPKEQ